MNHIPHQLLDELGSLPMFITNAGPNAVKALEQMFDGLAGKSRSRYASRLHRFITWCIKQDIALQGISVDDLRRYYKVVKGEFSPKTSRNYINAARRFIRCCMDTEAMRYDVKLARGYVCRKDPSTAVNASAPHVHHYLLDTQGQLPPVITRGGRLAEECTDELFRRLGNVKKTRTLMATARHLKKFCDWCETQGCSLDQVTSAHVEQLIVQLNRQYPCKNVARTMQICHRFYELLCERDCVGENPFQSYSCSAHETSLKPIAGDCSTIPPLIVSAGETAAAIYYRFYAQHGRYQKRGRSALETLWSFSEWCESERINLQAISSNAVLHFVQHRRTTLSDYALQNGVSFLRRLFNEFVAGGVISSNPFQGSTKLHRQEKRVTSDKQLAPSQVRQLFDSLDTSTLSGLRDQAILSVTFHAMLKVPEVIALNVCDFSQEGGTWWLKLPHRKIPANDTLVAHVLAYIQAAGLEGGNPLFQLTNQAHRLTGKRIPSPDLTERISLIRAKAGLPSKVNLTNLRRAGIQAYLKVGGPVEKLSAITGMSLASVCLYVEQQEQAVLFEGDLDNLLEFLGLPTRTPLEKFTQRTGIFRLTVEEGNDSEEE